jgi:CheY-like chemotaxis protein
MTLGKNRSKVTSARVLMVDDNKHGLTARKQVLEELGHRVTVTQSAHDALDQFEKEKFDLVVTDYKMPRMDGLELIARLRVLEPSVRVILLSGFVDTLGMNAQNTGADATLQKSANEVTLLIRAVDRLLNWKPKRKPARGGNGNSPNGRRRAS